MYIKHSIIVLMVFSFMSLAMGQQIWTAQTSGTTVQLRSITWGNNQFVAVGYPGTIPNSGTILTSPDGVTWTPRTSATPYALLGVSWVNNQFIAGDIFGTILTSSDGVAWTGRVSGTGGPLMGIAWGNNQFIIVGSDYGTIIASPDGIIWSTRSSSTSQLLYGVVWGSNQFIAVGASGTIITSPDGTSWTTRTSGTSNTLNSIAFGGINGHVAVGNNGTILTAPDGVTWTSRTSGTSQSLLSITWGNNQFVAVGGNGTVLTSPDGITWTTRTAVTTNSLRGITLGNNEYVAIGDNGTILTSSTTPPATPMLVLPANNATNIVTTPTLTWSTVVAAATYRVQLSTNSTFNTTVIDDSTLTVGSKGVSSPLSKNTIYYWRVNAKNENGTSAFSSPYTFTTIPPVPATPVLNTPANNATGIITTTSLTWGTVAGAATYRVQVSLNSTFTSMVVDDQTPTTGLYSPPTPLNGNTLYFWRVNATNAGGTSAFSTIFGFTTMPSPPATPGLLTPVNSTTNVQITPSLTWGTVVGAVTYRVQVSTISTFATIVDDDSTLTIGSKTISTALVNNTIYYWRVNAKNVVGASTFSSISYFTTVPAIPASPVLGTPLNNAVNVSTIPSLTWGTVAGATAYWVQLSLNSTFSMIIADDQTPTTGSYPITTPLSGTTVYFWRVSATNSGGNSVFSTISSFTTMLAQPAVPVLSIPSNGSIDVATTPTLVWSTVANAVSYRVQVATSSTFGTTVIDDSTVTSSSKSVSTALAGNATYYWRVSATNAGGSSAYSTSFNFTTTPPAPAAPVLLTPANNASLVGTTPTLTWGSVSNAATYRVQVATSSTFNTTVVDDSTLTVGSESKATSLSSGTYYWRVNAKNAEGTSGYSLIFSFTINITGINSITPQYVLTTLGHSGVLEVYRTNGTMVRKIAYEATASESQLLNTASKALAQGYYTYRFRRSSDSRVMIVGKLVK